MAQVHYLGLADGSTIDVTDRVENIEGWEMTEKAEEGAVGSGSIWLRDPDMDLEVDGLRGYRVIEDASEATDNVLFGGFVVDPELSRGESGTTHYDPLTRMWQLQLTDRNGYWNRRVMVGADCKRPAESDVTRLQWLLTTSEASWLDDASTYLSTASPTNMDKVDYRGQYLNQIIDDCSQQSGKNWWVQLQETGTGLENVGWYGSDGLTDYSSDLFLSNDPADWSEYELADGTSLVWPIADKTKLRKDTIRVYSGVYLRYANGTKAIYRRRAASVTAYGYRDYVADYPNVKTKTKANARATRLLADLANPDERITATVELPKGKASMLRAGMRVRFKASHLPGYTDWRWLRVLSCTVSPRAAGDRYRLDLELQGPGTSADGPPAPVYQTVTLTFQNTVVEDSEREGSDASSGANVQPDSVWRWTLTNPLHDALAYTWSIYASCSTQYFLGWGANPAGGMTTQPDQGVNCAYTAFGAITGSFTYTGAAGAEFAASATADYSGGCGYPSADEGWVIVLERLSP